jgi:neutral ceramidase
VAHYNGNVLKKLTLGTLGVTAATLLFLAIFPVRGSREAQPARVLSASRGAGPLTAGAAAVALAAPPGTPMGGYPRLRFASQGVRDEPMARAIVLSETGLAVAIASVDILLVPAALRAKVEARLGDLKLDVLLVGATHTHAGPGGYWKDALGERFGTGPHDPAWEDRRRRSRCRFRPRPGPPGGGRDSPTRTGSESGRWRPERPAPRPSRRAHGR